MANPLNLFTYTFQVKAPLIAVADFHRSTDTLKRLTPFPIIVQIHRLDPLGEQSISEFTLWFGPFPVHWVALHTDVDPLHGFTDTQTRGPLLHWKHTHTFTALSESSTQIVERIVYQHHPGLKNAWTRLVYAPWMLRFLFFYRSLVTRRALED